MRDASFQHLVLTNYRAPVQQVVPKIVSKSGHQIPISPTTWTYWRAYSWMPLQPTSHVQPNTLNGPILHSSNRICRNQYSCQKTLVRKVIAAGERLAKMLKGDAISPVGSTELLLPYNYHTMAAGTLRLCIKALNL